MNELTFEQVMEADLNQLADALLLFAGPVRVIAFYGEMGAGKTTFIRAVCHAMGVTENVSSPTFSLVNQYANKQNDPVYHFDFFRIESEREAVDIGCEEYFDSGHFCLIEWPEKILNLLPSEMIKVVIELTRQERRFTFRYD
jgi:tRNA threonylcarbamoyladenosine biosynthesis protein TsaE